MDIFGKSPVSTPVLISGKAAFFCSWLFPLVKISIVGTILYDSALTQTTGVILYAVGLSMVIVSIIQLGHSVAVGLPDRDTELKTHGLYRLTRNPIYLGGFMMCAGSCLFAIHLVNFFLFAIAVGVHTRIVRREEEFLEQRFGQQWLNYKRRVPRYMGMMRILYVFIFLAALYLLLLIPSSSPTIPPIEQSTLTRPFLWSQDARWDSLEASYAAARREGCDAERPMLDASMGDLERLLGTIENASLPPTAPEFLLLEHRFFALAPLIGACPQSVPAYLALSERVRTALKHQSEHWNLDDRTTRETLYRLLYGARSAVEEVILQAPPDQRPPALLRGTDEPSATPSATLLGVTIHSGDILVSRGGAPTSALIARGNDFQGNFSHIALVHVDASSGKLSIIESHIERGVAIATAEQYLRDTKLRVMVLRLRSDLPALIHDPLLPHRSASVMLHRALTRHIAYDFSMDYTDTTSLFCSEIASFAYAPSGVRLWMGISHLSTPGVRSWLADFGANHFETQEPSDLEYDPQLCVVAEWRDPETLRKDHIDNAATDAMLEGAERGDRLHYNWFMLPLARLVKAYSAVLNLFGSVGPIPEGMTATSALKHKFYAARHEAVVLAVRAKAERFSAERGFEPPYWEMLRMARRALESPTPSR